MYFFNALKFYFTINQALCLSDTYLVFNGVVNLIAGQNSPVRRMVLTHVTSILASWLQCFLVIILGFLSNTVLNW